MGKVKTMVLITMLLLALTALVVGCQNPVTMTEPTDLSNTLRQIQMNDLFWFVESYNRPSSEILRDNLLQQYLREHGENLDLEALAVFIIENIGNLRIIYDEREANNFLNTVRDTAKEEIVIELENGTKLYIFVYK